jgi:hypothetical protein
VIAITEAPSQFWQGAPRQWVGKREKRGPEHGAEIREMAMKKKVIFGTTVLLLAVLGFALDAGITATILFHLTERTIVEVHSNAG